MSRLFSGRQTTPPPPYPDKNSKIRAWRLCILPKITSHQPVWVHRRIRVLRAQKYSSISGFRGHLNKNMPCNGVYIRSSMQENSSLGPRVRTARALTGAGRSAPLLFAFWKVSYLNLVQAKFYFSS